MRETSSGSVSFGQNRARWLLHTGLLPGRICLAKTWPEPIRILASFAQYDLSLLWKNGTKCERGKLIAGQNWARWLLHGSSFRSGWHSQGKPMCNTHPAWFWQNETDPLSLFFPYPIRFRSPKDGSDLCKTGPDSIWFWLTVSGFGQTDPVRKQTGVQEPSGTIPQNEPGPLLVSCIRFRSVLPKTARTILRETGPDPIWFWVAVSGCGQTDPALKQTDMQTSSGPVLAKCNRPATSFPYFCFCCFFCVFPPPPPHTHTHTHTHLPPPLPTHTSTRMHTQTLLEITIYF